MAHFNHGGDVYSFTGELLDYSANISPLGLPQSVKNALEASIDSWARYPDPFCRDLTEAIGRHHNLSKQLVYCGNGAAELIYKVVQALKPHHAVITAPAFSEYKQALLSVECEILEYPLEEKDEFCLNQSIFLQLTAPVELLVLCNPNNPTGQPIEPKLITKILSICAENGIRVLLDECFVPFLDDPFVNTQIPCLMEYPNLIILRAFTKLYAMAGLRLGYLLCADEKLIQNILKIGQPWNVSTPAQIAGVVALEDRDYVNAVRQIVQTERAYLTDALLDLGMKVIGSQANYIFFRCSSNENLKERLLKHNILIRSCANYAGLDEHYYRISVRGHFENEKLVSALKGIIMEE